MFFYTYCVWGGLIILVDLYPSDFLPSSSLESITSLPTPNYIQARFPLNNKDSYSEGEPTHSE